MAPTSNEKFERTISDIEMWDHTRTLVPKSRNGASPGSKACGRVPGVALCTWYSDCAGEPGKSLLCTTVSAFLGV